MNDCVAIVSGGMDSITLLHYLVKVKGLKPSVISFVYGQKHIKEVNFARENAYTLGCSDYVVCDISSMHMLFQSSALVAKNLQIPSIDAVQGDNQPITYVPNRNMIFLALAAAYAESREVQDVFYGAQRHDMYGYWDTTPDFLNQINAVFALNRKMPINIKAPFVDYTKADILRTGLAIGVDYALTWSCYEGRLFACGICPTCAERLAAFAEVGIQDPLPYQS